MKARVYDAVMQSLKQEPATRNNDKLLIKEVLNNLGYFTLEDTLKKDAPSIASIVRARRSIQVYNPELDAVKEVKKLREEEQMKFYEFARYGITEVEKNESL